MMECLCNEVQYSHEHKFHFWDSNLEPCDLKLRVQGVCLVFITTKFYRFKK